MAVQISHTFKRTPTGAGIYYGWFEAMHSRFDLLVIGIEEDLGEALCHKVAEETLRLEKRLNRFDEESDIWQLNHLDNYDRYAADPELLAIFTEALRYREMTAGAFDIAVQTPDYRIETPCFAVDASCESIIKTRPDAIADFGGFGKGYALERARKTVVGAGVPSALLSFGNSSVCGIGLHPSGKKWQIGVENPMHRGTTMNLFDLQNESLSSSGNLPYNRGHIRSTRTGEPIETNRIVSVVSPSPIECEILSTALFAADAEQQEAIRNNFLHLQATGMDFSSSGYTVHKL